ncbi:hypothetical protein DCS_07756 [Drechmeria coniospora]|uniref:Maleylacetoacetate isomerase n=1 Tax=Drechmeria coniospora TaxID=98403 RepID=A0A151GFF6_DRECN|nr:hypothetical protein DCS_07756 [Drechmeria coniospora]KAH8836231.1 hypothetical protein RJ55_10055 [Drechmeria coniospora]KYK55792.1 hypothetical protein DCS_07756 [Drechmeria coniospora]
MDSADTFHLHTFYSSSCCQRIIIAAQLKSIPLKFSYINLTKDEQRKDDYMRRFNPSGSVPTLVVSSDTRPELIIRQSATVLEYFEERFPTQHPLLPPTDQPMHRALVRDFVNIITNDVQPPTNSRIAKRIRALRGKLDDQIEFVKTVFIDGLGAYEALLVQTGAESQSRGFTVGEEITMADICLIPAVDQALIYKLDLGFVPNIMRIYENLKKMAAFQAADWRRQEDTPEEHRV